MRPSPPAGSAAPTFAGRWALAVVVALPLLVAVVPRDLWPPEEPRFGRVAHEMASEGDWLVTRLNGLADAEKPPLLFWAIAGIERLVGRPTPLGARLPGAILACLAVLATARLARRWFRDPGLATTAAVLFGSTLLVLWNAPRVGMDLGLAATSAIALEGATAAVVDASWAGALRLGAAIGLGLLLKGPHALYVPLCGVVGGVLAMRRADPHDPVSLAPGGLPRLAAGSLLGIAIFAAWLVPAVVLRGGEPTELAGVTYRDRLLGQLGSRVSGENEPHLHGPLYLLPVFLGAGLPWIVFAAHGARTALRPRLADARDRFGLGAALGGALLPLVLLSIPGSKRETYVLPLLPCVSILAAYAVHRATSHPWTRGGVRAVSLGVAAVGLAVALLPLVGPRLWKPDRYDAFSGADLARPEIAVGSVVLGLAVALAAGRVAWSKAAPSAAVRRIALVICGLVLAGAWGFLPRFDAAESFADAAEVGHRAVPGAAYSVAGTTDVSSLWAFGARRAGRITTHRALAETLAPDAPPALVLAKARFWTQRARPERGVDPADLAALDRVRVLWERRVGPGTWHLLTNAPP